MFKFGEASLKNREGINLGLIHILDHAIKITKVDFGIPNTGGLRTAHQQGALYEHGASKADGYIKKSYHQTGRAVDVHAYVDGKVSYDELHLAMVAAAMLQSASALGYVVEWGGLFRRRKDMPHFQLIV